MVAPHQLSILRAFSQWECGTPKCSNVNYQSRNVCNRCGSRKPLLARQFLELREMVVDTHLSNLQSWRSTANSDSSPAQPDNRSTALTNSDSSPAQPENKVETVPTVEVDIKGGTGTSEVANQSIKNEPAVAAATLSLSPAVRSNSMLLDGIMKYVGEVNRRFETEGMKDPGFEIEKLEKVRVKVSQMFADLERVAMENKCVAEVHAHSRNNIRAIQCLREIGLTLHDLYSATGNDSKAKEAQELADTMNDNLWTISRSGSA